MDARDWTNNACSAWAFRNGLRGAAVCLLCACNSVDPRAGSEGTDVEQLERDEALIFELQLNACATAERCFGPLRASLGATRTPVADLDVRVDPCLERARELFDLTFPALIDSVAAGRVVYRPERLAACVQADAERECVELSALLEPCAATFEGQAELGQECATQFDCGPDAFCDLALTPEASCPAVCKPRLPAGSACVHPAECGLGLRCFDPEFMPGAPQQRRCLPPLAAGDRCTALNCGPGLVCAGASATETTCMPLARAQQPGEACTLAIQCGVGAACRADDGAAEPVCTAESEGAACAQSSECGAGEYCGCPLDACATNRCARFPGEGEACGQGASTAAACEHGLFCAGGTCQRQGLPDDSCDNNSMCATLYCSGGQCAVPGRCR